MEAIRSAGMHPPSLANRATARRWRGAKRWIRKGVATVAVALACGVGLAAVPRVARAGAAECIGDCDAGGSISIDEIVTGVGIALESVPLDRCSSFDCNGTGRVTVDCLVRAVQAALDGCTAEPTTPPATATPTTTPEGATQTAAPETPTATPTETSMPAACGSFVKKWGGFGGGNGQFNFPAGVAVDTDGHVFVVDGGGNRVERFTLDGEFVGAFGSPGTDDGQLNTPNGIAVDGKGKVYVADSNNNRIQTFTRDGTFLGQWGTGGSADGQFSGPVGVAVDGDGDVFVTDRFNNRIQKFTNAGTFITKWGTVGEATGQFASPYGIVVGGDGTVYVTDFFNARVQTFTNDGDFLSTWGHDGFDPGEFISPMGIALDRSGNVFVVDDANDRIRSSPPPARSSPPGAASGSATASSTRRSISASMATATCTSATRGIACRSSRARRDDARIAAAPVAAWRRASVAGVGRCAAERSPHPTPPGGAVHRHAATGAAATRSARASVTGGAERGGTIAAPHASRRCGAPPCGHRCRGYAECTRERHRVGRSAAERSPHPTPPGGAVHRHAATGAAATQSARMSVAGWGGARRNDRRTPRLPAVRCTAMRPQVPRLRRVHA
jgi:sugar lactone lactonase YvrE